MSSVIKRDKYLQKIINRKQNGLVKIITGIKGCGKSYLLFNLFYDYLLNSGIDKEHIIAISLDDDKNIEYRDPIKLSEYMREKIIDSKMYYILIDEVQYAISNKELKNTDEIMLYYMLNGLMRLSNVDVYVTTSNSKRLTKDVLTTFRGRGDEVKIYPLTFKEFYDFVGGECFSAFEDYALYGGMLAILNKNNEEEKANYLKNLFDEVYFEDILEIYNIKFSDVLNELTDDLCLSIGSLTNANKIAKNLKSLKNIKVSNLTIANYLEYLGESFLFNDVKRYDVKWKKYFEYPTKYYCVDIGLRNARLNFRQLENTCIMENIIYNELLVRGFDVDTGVVEIVEIKEEHRSKKQCEIDFVVNKGSKRYYIQSALDVSDSDKLNNKIRSLKKTNDFFKKVVITKTFMKPWYDEDGILHLGLYDFLLDEKSLEF